MAIEKEVHVNHDFLNCLGCGAAVSGDFLLCPRCCHLVGVDNPPGTMVFSKNRSAGAETLDSSGLNDVRPFWILGGLVVSVTLAHQLCWLMTLPCPGS